MMKYFLILAALAIVSQPLRAEPKKQAKKPHEFKWVNPIPKSQQVLGLKHGTFKSPSMEIDVGYCIYLPPEYENTKKRYPVIYYLHGGRPGGETKSIGMAKVFHQHIKSDEVSPMIYVFVNGGKVSHYNMPDMNSMGEDVFVKELIPHIDQTYRTIASRKGRGIEGFSQGGRGTTRIMFEHPELFCSAAPGGSGYATEKSISENDGWENDKLRFQPGHNAYDRARKYAANPKRPRLPIMIHVGTKGFNYENNLAYMKFLDSLNIPYEKTIAEGVPHSSKGIYETEGPVIMKFHERNFKSGE
jgi:S-formylglutathione hydrolase FrmB